MGIVKYGKPNPRHTSQKKRGNSFTCNPQSSCCNCDDPPICHLTISVCIYSVAICLSCLFIWICPTVPSGHPVLPSCLCSWARPYSFAPKPATHSSRVILLPVQTFPSQSLSQISLLGLFFVFASSILCKYPATYLHIHMYRYIHCVLHNMRFEDVLVTFPSL